MTGLTTSTPTPGAPAGQRLRLALSLRGGVSLAVWIGGAVRELDLARRSVGARSETAGSTGTDAEFHHRLATLVGYSGIDVDVMAGASAGGLNAVVLGAALATGRPVDALRKVWMDEAHMAHLVRHLRFTAPVSLLDGTQFHRAIVAALQGFFDHDPSPDTSSRFDLLLSATLLRPVELLDNEDPRSPVVETRSDALLHVRHDPRRPDQCDLTPFSVAPPLLAAAARSTASFPLAFEPWRIPPASFTGTADPDPRSLAGVLRVLLPRSEPVLLYDGGVVDNMPVGKAVRAIGQAPADGPTERWLLYLHPSPGVTTAESMQKQQRKWLRLLGTGVDAFPLDVVRSVIHTMRGKSLVADLRALAASNEQVDRQLRRRSLLLEQLASAPDGPVTAIDGRADALADGVLLLDLVANPDSHLDQAPRGTARAAWIQRAPAPTRQRFADALDGVAPLDWFTPEQQATFSQAVNRAVLTVVQEPALDGGAGHVPSLCGGSLRPWAPVVRMASLLIEYARWIERTAPDGRAGALKSSLYAARNEASEQAANLDLMTLEVVVGYFRDVVTAQPLQALVDDIIDERVRMVSDTIKTGALADAWGRLGRTALELRGAAPPARDAPPAEPGSPMDSSTALASLLGRRLAPDDPDDRALSLLDAIDVALLSLHQAASLGSADHIHYRTLAGTARSPLADEHIWAASRCPVLSSLKRAPSATDPPGSPSRPTADQPIDPASKLAGNQFHNFAAFLYREWRANDWMWGQADAAATLVDIMFEPRRVAKLLATASVDDTAAQVEAIVTSPFTALDPVPPVAWQTELQDLVDALWSTQAAGVAAELERLAKGAVDPLDSCRRALLARRHLEIVSQELSRSKADGNPTGKEPAASFTEACRRWDRAPRRLRSRWTDPRLALLAARSGLVTVRTLVRH